MSAEIKVNFLNDLEAKLSDRVTVSDMSTIMSSVSDVLEHYEFSRILHMDVAFSMDLFDTWISALNVQGLSPKTIKHYTYTMKRFFRDVNIPPRNVTVHHLRAWLAKEKQRGISDVTLNGNRDVFSSMFGWLWREGLIERDPTGNLMPIKFQKKVLEPIPAVDIEKLKSVCIDQRNLAIICFLLATGCRISEVVSLNRDQINFHDKTVVVLGKGNKQRTVYFDDVTAMHLQNYLNSRTDNLPALFIGKRTDRFQDNGVRVMLKKLAKQAGVENIHPHRFRRTLATMLIAHGMPIQEVSAILGHEKLDTTMKYIRLDDSMVKNDYRKFA